MSVLQWVAGACLLLAALPVTAATRLLFESEETVPIVLELPVADILRHAKQRPTVDGQMRYRDGSGRERVLDIAITTRGKSRLEMCRYPPLTVNFKKKQVESTLFAGQNKLKLVTPCQTRAAFIRYLDQEFAIYRAYNLLTDHSLRVRKLEITFRDSTGRRRDQVHEAFFLESAKRAADRLNMKTVKVDEVRVSQLDPEQLSILTLFQFMIGNTDWAVRRGPAGESCCHNGKVIGPPDSQSAWVVLPYDFDQSGIINASYALPSDRLPIRSVRQRLYRGFCSNQGQLDSTIALFNRQRAALQELFGGATDRPSTNRSARAYLDRFYAIINDDRRREREILAACQHTSD